VLSVATDQVKPGRNMPDGLFRTAELLESAANQPVAGLFPATHEHGIFRDRREYGVSYHVFDMHRGIGHGRRGA
jgi:hypothetical protein